MPEAMPEATFRPEDPPAGARRHQPAGRVRGWMLWGGILLLALGLRFGHLHDALQSPLMGTVVPMADSRVYLETADEILKGDLLGDEVFFLAPLYPYTMAVPLGLSGFSSDKTWPREQPRYDLRVVRSVQCLLGAVNCVLVFWIGTLIFRRRVGVIAGLMAAVYGPFIYFDGILMPPSLILFTHLSVLLFLILAERRGGWAWWLAAGVALGLSLLAHGTALLLAVLLVVWIWLAFRKEPWVKRLRWTALLAVGALPLVLTVTVRNYVVGDDLVLVTFNSGRVFYVGNNPSATGTFRQYPPEGWGESLFHFVEGIKRKPGDPKPSEISRRYLKRTGEFVRQEPGHALALMVRKLRLFFYATELGINDQYYFARRFSRVLGSPVLVFGAVAPLGLAGLLFGLRSGRSRGLLLTVLASQIVAFTLTFVLGRYRLVAVACLIIFGAAYLDWQWRAFRERRWRRMALGLLPAVFVAAFIHVPIEGMNRARGFGQQYRTVGRAYEERGQDELSIEAYRTALQHDFEPWVNGHALRARVYVRIGVHHDERQEWEESVEMYEAALEELGKEMPRFVPEKLETRVKTRLALAKQRLTRG